VRDAFIAAGHDAMSCDLLPTDQPGNHYQGNVLDILDQDWDLMIAHPPCTYLCASGLHWNKRQPKREAKTLEALEFVRRLLAAPIPMIALENPVGRISSVIRKPDQYIQPYDFGADASKKTGLWLIGLPKLKPTQYTKPRWVNGKARWSNQTDGGWNRLPPSKDRWKLRSTTYEGIARAMAEQWSGKKIKQLGLFI
tara:strand:+ start:188 stop:775 length:588 start_codon:yes stop_codon:yes gene_type:complete